MGIAAVSEHVFAGVLSQVVQSSASCCFWMAAI